MLYSRNGQLITLGLAALLLLIPIGGVAQEYDSDSPGVEGRRKASTMRQERRPGTISQERRPGALPDRPDPGSLPPDRNPGPIADEPQDDPQVESQDSLPSEPRRPFR